MYICFCHFTHTSGVTTHTIIMQWNFYHTLITHLCGCSSESLEELPACCQWSGLSCRLCRSWQTGRVKNGARREFNYRRSTVMFQSECWLMSGNRRLMATVLVLSDFSQALLSDETIGNAPVLVLGNKIDRPEAISEEALRGAFVLDGQVTGKVG